MDELSSLPFLDSVVRETLRLHPPVESASRTATRDDIIPLERPCIDARGRVQDHVKYVLYYSDFLQCDIPFECQD